MRHVAVYVAAVTGHQRAVQGAWLEFINRRRSGPDRPRSGTLHTSALRQRRPLHYTASGCGITRTCTCTQATGFATFQVGITIEPTVF